MIRRLGTWLRCVLVAVDQLAGSLIFGVPYLLALGPAPHPDETISSVVGRNALLGRRWALIAERPIDALFELLGGAPRHCRRMIEILPPFA